MTNSNKFQKQGISNMSGSNTQITLQREKGFTLIELMVVIAVIGVLAVIAIPTYRDYMLRGHRTEAKNMLLDVASRQEQYFTDNKTYTTSMIALGYGADPTPTEAGSYNVSIVAAAAGCALTNCFVAQAVPQDRQTDDECATLKISSTGEKTTTSTSTGCW